jgi:hypothetical protein
MKNWFQNLLFKFNLYRYTLEYTLRASFAEPSAPRCPFDCLGAGRCVARPPAAAAGNRTAAAAAAAAAPSDDRDSVDEAVTVDDEAPDWMCECPSDRTGAFCQDALRVLPLDTDVTLTLANGDWNYFVLNLDTLDSANTSALTATPPPPTTRNVIVEMRKIEREAFPLLYVKRGGPPAAYAGLYSPIVRAGGAVQVESN